MKEIEDFVKLNADHWEEAGDHLDNKFRLLWSQVNDKFDQATKEFKDCRRNPSREMTEELEALAETIKENCRAEERKKIIDEYGLEEKDSIRDQELNKVIKQLKIFIPTLRNHEDPLKELESFLDAYPSREEELQEKLIKESHMVQYDADLRPVLTFTPNQLVGGIIIEQISEEEEQ